MKNYEKLWEKLRDIPVDENNCIEEPYLHFEIGTECTDIWYWFEETFNISVGKLMYNSPQ